MISTRTTGITALAALTMTVACGGAKVTQGGGGGGGAGQGIAVRISPTQTQIASGGVVDFTATVTGSANTSVSWSVTESGGGTVNALGGYTAPSSTGTFHVVATSAADSTKGASAIVVVVPAGTVYALPADRATVWQPGVTYNSGIPTTRTQCGATLTPSGGDDSTQIQNAIDACASGHYVLLGPGNFQISSNSDSQLSITKSGITLRGSGAGVTIVTRTNGAVDNSGSPTVAKPVLWVGPNRWPAGPGAASYGLTAVAGNGDHGTQSVQVSGASAGTFTAGQIVLIDEMANDGWLPDTLGMSTSVWASPNYEWRWSCWNPVPTTYVTQYMNDCRTNTYSRDHRVSAELKEVASWNSSTGTLTFTTPIHMWYRPAPPYSAQVATFASADAPISNVGVEAMTIARGDNGNLIFQNCAYCWAKNVEITKWLNEGVRFNTCFRGELRDSYVHTPVWFEPGGGSYNIALDGPTSEVLIENSISRDADKVIVARGGGAGSVVAYNYMDDGHIGSNPAWQEMGVGASHFLGPHHILFEGNWGFNGDNDQTHGNSRLHTYFRNWLTGIRTSYDTAAGQGGMRAAGVTSTTNGMSFVGNVLGVSGRTSNLVYESTSQSASAIWMMGYLTWAPYTVDPNSLATTVRDGNFDFLTNQVHWHGLGGSGQNNGLTPPAASTLPNSLYMSGKPAFFGSSPWPWVDPFGTTKVYTLPAKARYDAGTPNVVP